MTTPTADEFQGTPRYTVLRRLGAGGMGVVYLAHDNERGMDVALKVLMRIDADGIYRLKNEFRALADVSHPNLVGLFELGAYGDQWFFTMEVVEGVDFQTWVSAPDPSAPVDPAVAAVLAEPTMATPLLDDMATMAPADLAALVQLDAETKRERERVTAMMTIAGDATPEPVQTVESDATMGWEEAPVRVDVDPTTGHGPPATHRRDPSAIAVVRRARPLNERRLRDAMRQLAEAVHAIHLGGKLHRDIKPSNALVTPDGRVVMLDFGLVQDDASLATLKNKRESRHDEGVSGTPAYMAPEQATGGEVTTASDWYAVGVMLYQALTGQLPFEGSVIQLLYAKSSGKPVPPQAHAPGVPDDLADLAMRLLEPKPRHRPSEAEILRLLGNTGHTDSGMTVIDDVEPELLGRDAEIGTLRHAWRTMQRERQPVLVHLAGPAGMGKTALLDAWLTEVAAQEELPTPLVLSGRCHERETVPYKAFDAVIDALTRHLLRLTMAELEQTLPSDVATLGQIFPVLRRVPAIARAPLRQAELEDRRGLLRRATVALKRLLTRVAQQRPLLLVIDDLQWGDVDSAELLATLLDPPDPLPALVLLAWRDEDTRRNPVLQAVRRVAEGSLPASHRLHVTLGPLSRETATELALKWMPDQSPESRRRAEILAKEAAGSPLFIVELVRFRQSSAATMQSHTDPEVSLDQVLQARIDTLPAAARWMLDLVAVAGKPVQQKYVYAAAALGREEPVAIARLRNGRYVRTGGTGDDAVMETFHNRIREAAMALIPADVLRERHRAWLSTYVTADPDGQTNLDALAFHAHGAGDAEATLRYGLHAARQAHAVFANHDALRHFTHVLDVLAADPEHHGTLLAQVQEEAAEAARQAGLYDHARDLLEKRLAKETAPDRIADLHVGLGRVAQERGDAGEAIVQMETALQLFGKRAPQSLWQLGLESFGLWIKHLARTWLPTFTPTRSEDPHDQKRADIMFALIRVYYFLDVAKVIWAGLITINMAPRFRKDGDKSLAYSFFGVLLFGMGLLKRSEIWCSDALTLARMGGDPVAEAIALMRLGTTVQFANRLDRGQQLLGEAIEQFKAIGEMWELQTGLMLHATSHFMTGDFRGALPIYDEMGRYGEQLNMLMHRGWHAAWSPFCRYLLGELDAASTQQALEQAVAFSARARDVANTVAALQHMANLAVREGQIEVAAGIAVRTHECVGRYLVLVPFLQRAWIDAAEAALFALENNAVSVSHGKLQKIVRDGYRRAGLIGLAYPYLRGPAQRIRARWVAYKRGEKAAAPLFQRAISHAEGTPNRWETAHVWYDAALCLPSRRAECKAQARRLFMAMGCVAELRRMEREMPD